MVRRERESASNRRADAASTTALRSPGFKCKQSTRGQVSGSQPYSHLHPHNIQILWGPAHPRHSTCLCLIPLGAAVAPSQCELPPSLHVPLSGTRSIGMCLCECRAQLRPSKPEPTSEHDTGSAFGPVLRIKHDQENRWQSLWSQTALLASRSILGHLYDGTGHFTTLSLGFFHVKMERTGRATAWDSCEAGMR